jgi:hypothetical protein
MRKLAARLICELAYKNHEAQEFICSSFGISPIQGKICINKMPLRFKEDAAKDPKFILKLREKSEEGRWWCYPPLEDLKEFPDPAFHLIGFVWTNATHKKNYSLISTKRIASPDTKPKGSLKGSKPHAGKVPLLIGKKSSLKKDKNNHKKYSPGNVVMTERSVIADKLQKALSNAKGHPSSKQSPSWLEHEFFKPETGIIRKKYEMKENSMVKTSLKSKELERSQPMSYDGRAKDRSKQYTGRKSINSSKLKTDKEMSKKNPLVKQKGEKSSGFKTAMEVTQKISKDKANDNSTLNIYKRNSKFFLIFLAEILSFISTTRNSIGLTTKHEGKGKKTLASKKASDATHVADGVEIVKHHKKRGDCRLSYIDPIGKLNGRLI